MSAARSPTRIVCSLPPTDAAAITESLRLVPPGVDLVEIRADALGRGEIAEVVAAAGRPVIVTVRRRGDGGGFEDSEEVRRACLRTALDAGADYVDVEHDSALADLASGPDAPRVILSSHGVSCEPESLRALHERMSRTRAAVLKIVTAAASTEGAPALRGLLERSTRRGRPLTAFALGPQGAFTRVLAGAWGSWATYGSLAPSRETAAGQLTADDLIEVHDVPSITSGTLWFALLGRGVLGSPSPAMHRAGFRETGLDARYVPIDLGALDSLDGLRARLGVRLEGLAVTIPLKQRIAAACRPGDPLAAAAGAVNTVRRDAGVWVGHNTDGPGAVDRVGRHLEIGGARVALVGAGGTARGLAVAFRDAGARVCVFHRAASRAAALVGEIGVESRPLSALAPRGWDVLINATPLGREGERVLGRLEGRVVLDAAYGPRPTPLVELARRTGLATVDGLEMLAAQGARQFELLTGRAVAFDTLHGAARRWLARRAP